MSVIDGASRTIDDLSSFCSISQKDSDEQQRCHRQNPSPVARIRSAGRCGLRSHSALLARYDVERGARSARPAGRSTGTGADDRQPARPVAATARETSPKESFRQVHQVRDRDFWGIEEWWENGEFTGLELNRNG